MEKVILPSYVHNYPAPAVLIGCGEVDKPNLITCSWFGTVCSEPPTVSVSIRPSRFSYPLVNELDEFTVNIPRTRDLEKVKFCGTYSGREMNKFEKLGIQAVPCPPLKHAPMIAEFDLVLACQVKEKLHLGTHTMFVGEIMAIHAHPDIKKPSGRANSFSEDQIVYLDGKYWSLKEL